MRGNITLRLLGPVQVERDGVPVQGFESQKALAMLCYLALHPHPLPRSHLAALFWGNKPETRSRGNLRRALTNLTSLVPECLHVERQAVAFRRGPACHVDADRFRALVERGDRDALAEAVALYRGELLAGVELRQCPEFELWLVVERERWHRKMWQVLEALVHDFIQCGEYEQALVYVDHLLRLEPWREEVHRQKMELLARVRQYSAALAQYEACCRILEHELGVEPTQETQRLYRRILAARSSPRRRLPPQPTPFVGRQEELRAVGRLLKAPDCRLVTLIGPGGIGKTRLALEAAQQNAGRFLHGVCFVPLAPVGTAFYLASTVVQALGLTLHGGKEATEHLLHYLEDKELLLVLDGFEHLLDGAGMLTEILEQAPDVKLLVTSRERLRLRWEWTFEVRGLDYPREPLPDVPAPEIARKYSAVALFDQVARRTGMPFHLDEELADVVTICRLVDGMPLGIELAAVWAARYGCRATAEAIEQNVDVLRTEMRDMPERHRSMRATFEHSWRLLGPDERRVFRSLSVFRGRFSEEAALAVVGAPQHVLEALVDKSLVRRADSKRYEIHELLRQYAEEKLEAVAQEATEIRDRHSRYYLGLLCRQEPELEDVTRPEVVHSIAEDIENVRIAWFWALQRKHLGILGEALNPLYIFYELWSRFREGEALLECTAVTVRRQVDKGDRAGRLLLARLLVRQGSFARYLGESPKGRQLLREGLQMAREMGERTEMAFALNSLGILAGMHGDYAEELEFFRESLSLYRALGDRRRVAVLLNNLAIAHRLMGAYDEAERLSRESLALSRTMGNRRGMARALQHLALVAHVQGAYPEAERYYRESLELFREIGDRWGIALTLGNLGDLAYRRGEYAAAETVLEESLTLRREMNDRWGTVLALNTLGGVARARGDLQKAERCFRSALHESLALRSETMVMEIFVEWAQLLMAQGNAQQAVEMLALVAHHPATEEWTRDMAEHLLEEVSAALPPDVAADARRRGRARSPEQAVAALTP